VAGRVAGCGVGSGTGWKRDEIGRGNVGGRVGAGFLRFGVHVVLERASVKKLPYLTVPYRT